MESRTDLNDVAGACTRNNSYSVFRFLEAGGVRQCSCTVSVRCCDRAHPTRVSACVTLVVRTYYSKYTESLTHQSGRYRLVYPRVTLIRLLPFRRDHRRQAYQQLKPSLLLLPLFGQNPVRVIRLVQFA